MGANFSHLDIILCGMAHSFMLPDKWVIRTGEAVNGKMLSWKEEQKPNPRGNEGFKMVLQDVSCHGDLFTCKSQAPEIEIEKKRKEKITNIGINCPPGYICHGWHDCGIYSDPELWATSKIRFVSPDHPREMDTRSLHPRPDPEELGSALGLDVFVRLPF